MTEAACFKCGEIKWGAFNPCKQCQALPRTDDELMSSLAFTDHYFERDKLQQIGREIEAGGTPRLTDAWKEELAPAVQEAKRVMGIDQRRPKKATSKPRRHLRQTRVRILLALLAIVGLGAVASLWIYQNQPKKSHYSIADQFKTATRWYRDHEYELAAEIMQPFAEAGDVNAQVNLANALYWLRSSGENSEEEKKEEIKYLCLAALQDDAEAQNHLGLWTLYKDKGTDAEARHLGSLTFYKGNEAEAVFWWQRAANNGSPEALYTMAGNIHFAMYGLSRDDEKAVRMLRKAAEMGHDGAQFDLANIYWDGKGDADPPWTTARQDYAEAAKWYLAAAKRGNTFAQEKIGLMYYRGIALTQNFAEAYFWLNLATSDSIRNYMASKRSDDAQEFNASKKMRDEAGSRLTPERLNLIQDQLKNWSALPSASHSELYEWRDHPAIRSQARITRDNLPAGSICSQ
jgi:TPR repeat protein